MLLLELFDNDIDVTGDLKNDVMDILTPMVASKVPFVTVQSVIDKLSQLRTGLNIDRGLVLNILDPDKVKMVKMVKKVEGDRIYLSLPIPDADALGQDQEQRQQEKQAKTAQTQAKKAQNTSTEAPPL